MKRSLTLLLVVAALLLGVAGGASAAKLITGKQIKNGTVTGADVKNTSLKGLDVKDGSLKGADLRDGTITGADLAAGSVDTGEIVDGGVSTSDLAPTARTVARTAKNTSQPLVATCDSDFINSCPSLLSVNLGTGTWWVTGTMTVANNSVADSDLETCGIYDSTKDALVDKSAFRLFGFETAGSRQNLAFQGIVTTSGIGILQLRCTEGASQALVTNDLTLTAISLNAAG